MLGERSERPRSDSEASRTLKGATEWDSECDSDRVKASECGQESRKMCKLTIERALAVG